MISPPLWPLCLFVTSLLLLVSINKKTFILFSVLNMLLQTIITPSACFAITLPPVGQNMLQMLEGTVEINTNCTSLYIAYIQCNRFSYLKMQTYKYRKCKIFSLEKCTQVIRAFITKAKLATPIVTFKAI